MYKFALLAAVVALTACATQQVPIVRPVSVFDAAKANEMLQPGANTIKGSALMRQNGGSVVTCAGLEVALIPSTEYARERIEYLYGSVNKGSSTALGRVKFTSTDPAYITARRSVICDSQGYFKFERVANGEFFLITSITWKTNQYNTQGGTLMQRVTIAGGEVKEVVLAP